MNGMGDVPRFFYDADGNVTKQIRYAEQIDLQANPNASPDNVLAS